jgi:hypothetical protein
VQHAAVTQMDLLDNEFQPGDAVREFDGRQLQMFDERIRSRFSFRQGSILLMICDTNPTRKRGRCKFGRL